MRPGRTLQGKSNLHIAKLGIRQPKSLPTNTA